MYPKIKVCVGRGYSPIEIQQLEDTDLNTLDKTVVGAINEVFETCVNELDTKVDKVSGKGLSTNDYTVEDKNKLDGVEEGANKTVVDTSLSDTSTNPVQNKVINAALENKANVLNPEFSGYIYSSSADGQTSASMQPNNLGTVVFAADDELNSIYHSITLDPRNNSMPKFRSFNVETMEKEEGFFYTELNPPTIDVDSALSSTSENPVQNKAVQAALSEKANLDNPEFTTGINISNQSEFGTPKTKITNNESYTSITHTVDGSDVASLIVGDNPLLYAYNGELYAVYSQLNPPPVDTSLSSTSTNPVQNKILYTELADKVDAESATMARSATIHSEDHSTRLHIKVDTSGDVMFHIEEDFGADEPTYQYVTLNARNKMIPKFTRGGLFSGEKEEGFFYTELNPPTRINGFSFASMTQDEYDALETKDENTIYLVV